MRLTLDEEQALLLKTAQRFAREKAPVGRLRAFRDRQDPVGFDPALWGAMVDLGFVGLAIPEAMGGLGLGIFEQCLVLEAIGARLMPEPLLGSAMLAVQTLLFAGESETSRRWLEATASGAAIVSVAWLEPGQRFERSLVRTSAVEVEGGYVLTGRKLHALAGGAAGALIVSARTRGEAAEADGISLFVVEAGARGLEVEPQWRVDGQPAAAIRLDGVAVGPEALIGGLHAGGAALEAAIERATVGLCAEMLGGAVEAFEVTLAYLKERRQFDVPIGSFQALQHRAARLFVELSLTRSAVLAAARAADEGVGLERAASLAKARCAEVFVKVTNEAVQMHGGVGVTDEYDVGLYLKRARAAAVTFGDAAWHRDRWARLGGF